MEKKYYAVRVGKTPGIFFSWEACESQVQNYPGAVYKSFFNIKAAEDFVLGTECEVEKKTSNIHGAYAFVDGSYNTATATYGYGGFLMNGNDKYLFQGSGTDAEMASMRNVAGEILGCIAAVSKAVELGMPELTVYYDYIGIEMWAGGHWKRNRKGTIAYYEFMQSVKDKIKITFGKVKGHSGIEGNEEADRLAKQAVGLEV